MNDGTHTAAAFNKAGTSSATFSLTLQSCGDGVIVAVERDMVMFTLSYVTLTVKEFSIAVTRGVTSLFQCNSQSNYISIEAMNIYGVIVVFVTDIFWQLSIRSSSTVMILSINI